MDKLELIVVLIISIFTFFIPLMIYLLVRSGKRCRKCRRKSLIPLDSPAARAALETTAETVHPRSGPVVTPVTKQAANRNFDRTNSAARTFGNWVGRHPLWAIFLLLLFVGWLGRALLTEPSKPTQQQASEIPLSIQTKAIVIPDIPPPTFRVFKLKTDAPTSYIVPVNSTDEQLRSLLWFFRQKVRAGEFREIGITQPTSKQWGENGYKSGMLLVYRGEKCASEEYLSAVQIERGDLGPCGYGEHEDAAYQWGISGDPEKDSGDIRARSGDLIPVFDYKDNWRPMAAAQR